MRLRFAEMPMLDQQLFGAVDDAALLHFLIDRRDFLLLQLDADPLFRVLEMI